MHSLLSVFVGLILGSGTAFSAVTLSPETLSFGFVRVGLSATQTVKISNPENVAQKLDLKYLNSIDFKFYEKCPKELPAGSSCEVKVVFMPVLNMSVYSVIEVTTSTGLQKVHIYGTGIESPTMPPIPVPTPGFEFVNSASDVKVTFTAKSVLVSKDLNRARIVEPVLNFDKDLGYGLKAFPFISPSNNYSDYVSNLICKAFGFNVWRANENLIDISVATPFFSTKQNADMSSVHFFTVEPSKETQKSYYTTVVCYLK